MGEYLYTYLIEPATFALKRIYEVAVVPCLRALVRAIYWVSRRAIDLIAKIYESILVHVAKPLQGAARWTLNKVAIATIMFIRDRSMELISELYRTILKPFGSAVVNTLGWAKQRATRIGALL